MVYLTGDTHGELDRFKEGELRRAGKGDIVIVLGDFGFVWDGSNAVPQTPMRNPPRAVR